MGGGDEALQRVLGRLMGPRHGNQQRAHDGVALRGIEIGKGLVELLFRARVERIETVAVEGLAVGGRDGDEEVDELGRTGVEGSRVAAQGRHQQIAQALQGRELRGGEKASFGFGDGIGIDHVELGYGGGSCAGSTPGTSSTWASGAGGRRYWSDGRTRLLRGSLR